MREIRTEVILAYYFLHSRVPLTYKKLREIKYAIESKIEDAHADIAENSLAAAIEYFPNLFQWEQPDGNKIISNASAELLISFKRIYTDGLDIDIKNSVQKIFNEGIADSKPWFIHVQEAKNCLDFFL